MKERSDSTARLVVYGHRSCGLALKLEATLKRRKIDFEWRDVEVGQPAFHEELSYYARGHLAVPTVVFPDGVELVEPQPDDVLRRHKWGRLAGLMWLVGLA